MQREDRAALLFAFVDTPTLTDRERGLMREIALKYSMDQHHNWDPTQRDEVAQLFEKVKKCFGL